MLKRIQETLKRNDICIAFAILLFSIYIAALSNYYSYMINVLSSIGACTFWSIGSTSWMIGFKIL